MLEKGVLNGYPDGTFRPSNVVLRSEFAKMMALSAGLNVVPSNSKTYTDVSVNSWYHPYAEAAKNYMYCYDVDGVFKFFPELPATREEVAEALVRLIGYDISNIDIGNIQTMFSDYSLISGNARLYVAAAVEHGLFTGYGDGTFRAKGNLTRAEASSLLYRTIITFSKPESTPYEPSQPHNDSFYGCVFSNSDFGGGYLVYDFITNEADVIDDKPDIELFNINLTIMNDNISNTLVMIQSKIAADMLNSGEVSSISNFTIENNYSGTIEPFQISEGIYYIVACKMNNTDSTYSYHAMKEIAIYRSGSYSVLLDPV